MSGLLAAERVEPLPREVIIAALVADDDQVDTPGAGWADTAGGGVLGGGGGGRLAGGGPPRRREPRTALSRRIGETKYARHWRLRPGMAGLVAEAGPAGTDGRGEQHHPR